MPNVGVVGSLWSFGAWLVGGAVCEGKCVVLAGRDLARFGCRDVDSAVVVRLMLL